MINKKLTKIAIFAIVLTASLLAIATAGLLTSSQNVPASGTISTVNLGCYSNSGCTTTLTSVDFGSITPGSQSTVTVYIKNTGTIAENLTMSTNTWNPANANTYLTLTWSPASTTLAAGATTSATLTLAASSSAGALSTFSVNVVFTGTQ
jgi:hypothetical protein